MAEIVKISPKNKLVRFYLLNSIYTGNIYLDNDAGRDICFRFRATHPDIFKVKPNVGMLGNGDSPDHTVTIEISAANSQKFKQVKTENYRFQLQVIYAPEEDDDNFDTFDPIKVWNDPDLASWFRVSESKFRAKFVSPGQEPYEKQLEEKENARPMSTQVKKPLVKCPVLEVPPKPSKDPPIEKETEKSNSLKSLSTSNYEYQNQSKNYNHVAPLIRNVKLITNNDETRKGSSDSSYKLQNITSQDSTSTRNDDNQTQSFSITQSETTKPGPNQNRKLTLQKLKVDPGKDKPTTKKNKADKTNPVVKPRSGRRYSEPITSKKRKTSKKKSKKKESKKGLMRKLRKFVFERKHTQAKTKISDTSSEKNDRRPSRSASWGKRHIEK